MTEVNLLMRKAALYYKDGFFHFKSGHHLETPPLQ